MIDIQKAGIIAIIRHDRECDLLSAARALAKGGITAMEITLNTPDALSAISAVRAEVPGIRVGAGTILEVADAEKAIGAGAEFIVTPTVQPDSIRACRDANIPIVCGCMTPTEALTAHRAGADFLKVFPADSLGPAFIKAILGPMPFLKLVPTGGVSLGNIKDFFAAGSTAVAVGSHLVSRSMLESGDWAHLEEVASQFAAAKSL